MAEKKSILGTLALLGTAAAATALAYKNREEIRAFFDRTAERLFAGAGVQEPEEEAFPPETDIVIDNTVPATQEEPEETEEEERTGE